MDWLLELTGEPGEFTINVLHEIEKKEVKEIEKSIIKVNEIEQIMRFISSLKSEYYEYTSCVEENKSSDEIVRRVSNYLSACISFINQWGKYMSKKEEVIRDYYDTTRRNLHANSFEYRLVYNLRNYDVHGGQPVSTIEQSFEKGTLIKLNRKSFLNKYKKEMQAPFRKELEKMELEDLDVDNAIRVTHTNILRFHDQIINSVLQYTPNQVYLNSSINITRFQKKYNREGGNIGITSQETIDNIRRIRTEPSQHDISYVELPFEMAKIIIKGARLKFSYKGKYVGLSEDLPYLIGESPSDGIPKFYGGQKYIYSNGIEWKRVTQSLGTHWQDGYDRYFSLYMPEGLSIEEYMEVAEKYKSEKAELFSK